KRRNKNFSIILHWRWTFLCPSPFMHYTEHIESNNLTGHTNIWAWLKPASIYHLSKITLHCLAASFRQQINQQKTEKESK
ncbi:MAG: hypothetical protein UE068_09385, partial [Paludibacteraceae bacterium]|nr:hypothetical protein [Paludibacteraceae bacterium]